MADIETIQKKSEKTFIIVCANFAMLAILFLGLGFVIFQAATLVTVLKQDLARAEQQVVELKDRVQEMSAEAVIEKAVATGMETFREEMAESMPGSEALEKLAAVPEKLDATAEAVQAINEMVQDLDSDAFAQRLSYNILKGLGQGFEDAAESRKPAAID
jgi:cell division protein FtsL